MGVGLGPHSAGWNVSGLGEEKLAKFCLRLDLGFGSVCDPTQVWYLNLAWIRMELNLGIWV